MARQPMSMIGHMYAATNKTLKIMLAPVTFVGRAAGQALDRLIPHGASELGQAMYGGGSAYAPPGVTERLTPPGNVHGTGAGQAVQAPAIAPPRQTHDQALEQAAARASSKPQQQKGMER